MADDIFQSETYTPDPKNLHTKGTEKLLLIIFVVDISGSMRQEGRIDAVNEAFTRMIPALRQLQMECMSEYEMKIAIMTFDAQSRWIVDPTYIMDYTHEEIDCTEWMTYYSKAFQTLGEKLTKKEFMAHERHGGLARPYIMFMTDGEPTAGDPYDSALDELLQNGYFKQAERFAVLIGRDAINSAAARKAVGRFVSEEKNIVNAVDAEQIASEVQAHTLQTVAILTKQAVHAEEPEQDSADNGMGDFGSDDGFGGFGGLGNFGGFDDDDLL